jgi:hypothetical protein
MATEQGKGLEEEISKFLSRLWLFSFHSFSNILRLIHSRTTWTESSSPSRENAGRIANVRPYGPQPPVEPGTHKLPLLYTYCLDSGI